MKKNYLNIILFTVLLGFFHANDKLPYIEEYLLDNGMRILIAPNYDTPSVAMQIWIDAGRLDDPIGKPGLSQRVFDGLYHGTDKFSTAKDLEDAFNGLGNDTWRSFASRSIGYDNISIGLQSFLKSDTENAIEVMSEILRRPTFRGYKGWIHKIFKKIFLPLTPRSLLKYDGWDEMINHSVYLLNGFYEPIRPHLSVYTRKEVRRWHEQHIRPDNITIMVSGDINSLYIKRLVNKYFGDWSPSIETDKARTYDLNEGNHIRVIDRPENVTYLRLTFPSTELDNFWSPPIQMALIAFGKIANNRLEYLHNYYLDQAGSIGVEWQQSNRIPFAAINSFALPYSHVDRFYDLLIDEFKKPITPKELENAKRWRANVYKNARNSGNANLNTHVQYYYSQNGYSIRGVDNMISDINDVTLEQVNSAAQKVFNPNNFKAVIVGSKDSLSTFVNKFENVEYFQRLDEINSNE